MEHENYPIATLARLKNHMNLHPVYFKITLSFRGSKNVYILE